ncbi:hypothetical protein BCR32DRAFT_274115 [Anaeromyces robustus]|uniref:Uncharacterized protein n=1 Tax=Anaeromyces robustus TaxID=1754192 RepID=A0A1Y1XQG2_9FUNG|nr:hypothetical protein BCR32DRAFT_274115 [Anaeromyces robustus]|eukprot:ORX87905.1 hypothetical protein BCR32DRAFT_274115 [Anaeromyces robustus]
MITYDEILIIKDVIANTSKLIFGVENKNKCILNNVPDLTHEKTEDYHQRIDRKLDKILSSSVNSHMNLEHFYLLLKSRLETISDHLDHNDFQKMNMTDTINEMMYGVSTSKVGAVYCRHLLVEGYQNVFKNEKHAKKYLNIYRDSLHIVILYSFDNIEQYINDNLVNDTVKKNLDSILGKMTNFHKSPLISAFSYRLESIDHRRNDRITLIKKSNEPHIKKYKF